MKQLMGRALLILVLVAAGMAWNGEILPILTNSFVTTVEAWVGRPATPVSYAGVARRTTVRRGTPANRGGPVNRVGRR